MDPVQIFSHHGPRIFPYLVFGCAVVENDLTFIMAGVYAASIHPHLDLVAAIAAGVAGALVHDSVWFWLGHNRSTWLRKSSAWKRLGPQIENWAARFGVRELLFCRLIPGTRNVSILFWGVHRMKPALFYGLEVLGLLCWGTLLTLAGFKFGQQAQAFLGKVKEQHLGRWLLLALLLSALIYWGLRLFTRHEIVKHGKPPPDPRAD